MRTTDDHGKDWLSAHVFFAGNPNPMLVELMLPLSQRLRADGLIDRSFFIRYWTEGTHIRFRVRPREGVERAAVIDVIERETQAFLTRRPFLFRPLSLDRPDVIRTTFLAEYPQSKWDELYGADGVMPTREPNQLLWSTYEPEFARYGGPDGCVLAERHFEASSDMVLDLLATSNLHIRSIALGAAAQIMTVMCLSFFGSVERAAQFLQGYEERWRTGWGGLYAPASDSFDAAYASQSARLTARVHDLIVGFEGRRHRSGPPSRWSYLEEWAAHCDALGAQIRQYAEAGRLVFPLRRDSVEWTEQRDPDFALNGLAFSYIHMTNNRLGVPIVDEIYLAFLLRRAMQDLREPVRA